MHFIKISVVAMNNITNCFQSNADKQYLNSSIADLQESSQPTWGNTEQ